MPDQAVVLLGPPGSGKSTLLRHYELGRAIEGLDDARDEAIVQVGAALSVLEEDPATDEMLYRHQLLQEYLAGRKLAKGVAAGAGAGCVWRH